MTGRAQSQVNRVLALLHPEDGVELPTQTLSGLHACTIESWVKWEDFVPFAQPWRFGGAKSSIGINTFRGNPTLQLFAYETDGTLHATKIPSILRLHQWYHLAAVIDPDSGLQLYLNGMLVGRTTQPLHPIDQLAAYQPAMLGISPWESNGHFKGFLDEVRIWDHVRSQTQIREGMRDKASGAEPGLRALWTFDVPTNVMNASIQRSYALLGKAQIVESDWQQLRLSRAPWGVHGIIRDQNQQPLAQAAVAVWNQGIVLRRVTSDSDGRYHIVVGSGDADVESVELVVHHDTKGYRAQIGPIKTGESIVVNPVLEPDLCIQGSVMSWNGQPLGEVLVEAVPFSDESSITDTHLLPHAWVWTDAMGGYQFSNLPEASYRLRVHTPEGFAGIRQSTQADGRHHLETLLNAWEEGSLFKVKSDSVLGDINFRIPSFQKPRAKLFDQIAMLDDIQVLSMTFDHAERLWIGFENGGLAVGENGDFKPVSSEQFPEKKVRALLHDGNRLWVGTDHGVYWQQGAERVFLKPDACHSLVDHEIWSLTLGTNGGVWIGSDNGLFYYSPTDPDPLQKIEVFNTMWIRDVLVEEGKPVWVATWGNGAFEQTETGWQQWESGHGLVDRHVSTLMRDQIDRIWMGTDGGISIFDPVDQSFSNKTGNTGLLDDFVTDIVQGQDGTIWVATKGAGLARVDEDNWSVWFDTSVLPNTYVTQCLVDSGGDLWVGTHGGLTRLDYRHLRIVKLRTSILAMDGNDRGDMWIGTQGQGVFHYDGIDFQQVTIKDGLAHDHASCIFVDPLSGHTFVGGPIGVTELANAQVLDTYLNPSKPEGAIPEIRDITRDETGHLWLASWLKGLIRFHPTSRSVTRFAMEGKPADYLASCVAVSPVGMVWCGTEKGLYVLRDDRLEMHSAVASISDASIEDLQYEPGGEALWIVSDKGVFRLGVDMELIRISPEHLTRLSRGKQIRFSPEQHVAWLSLSFGGVGVYNHGQWSVIDTLKGLPASHRTIQAIYAGESGVIWGGTSAGVFRWEPTTSAPKVSVLLKSQNNTTEIHPDQIPSKPIKLLADRRLTISFSSTSMVGSQLERIYQYRLLDHQADPAPWKIISADQSEDLVIQQPGNYTFEYRGLDELANAHPSSRLDLMVLPRDFYTPWYQRTKFIAFFQRWRSAWWLYPG